MLWRKMERGEIKIVISEGFYFVNSFNLCKFCLLSCWYVYVKPKCYCSVYIFFSSFDSSSPIYQKLSLECMFSELVLTYNSKQWGIPSWDWKCINLVWGFRPFELGLSRVLLASRHKNKSGPIHKHEEKINECGWLMIIYHSSTPIRTALIALVLKSFSKDFSFNN